jgi:hypothetical protein
MKTIFGTTALLAVVAAAATGYFLNKAAEAALEDWEDFTSMCGFFPL